MASPKCGVPPPACEHACSGSEEVLGPFICYISKPSAAPKAAVILASDVFGFESPLLRKLADKIALHGYLVVVPDYFYKDPFNPEAGVPFADWLEKHQPIDGVDGTIRIVDILENKGISSVGAVGFCWGAKVVVELAKGHALKAAILCHPSLVSVDDIKEVKVPIAILAAEVDDITPPAVVMQFQEILNSKNKVPSFVKIYPGTTHGWVIRYNVNDMKEVEKAEEAHVKILEWLETYVQ